MFDILDVGALGSLLGSVFCWEEGVGDVGFLGFSVLGLRGVGV